MKIICPWHTYEKTKVVVNGGTVKHVQKMKRVLSNLMFQVQLTQWRQQVRQEEGGRACFDFVRSLSSKTDESQDEAMEV